MEEILSFLGGGTGVLRAAGLGPDWLSPDGARAVPIGFRTDGEWLWSEELRYYIRVHGVVPEGEFVAHMLACGFVARAATSTEADEAAAMLQSGSE